VLLQQLYAWSTVYHCFYTPSHWVAQKQAHKKFIAVENRAIHAHMHELQERTSFSMANATTNSLSFSRLVITSLDVSLGIIHI